MRSRKLSLHEVFLDNRFLLAHSGRPNDVLRKNRVNFGTLVWAVIRDFVSGLMGVKGMQRLLNWTRQSGTYRSTQIVEEKILMAGP